MVLQAIASRIRTCLTYSSEFCGNLASHGFVVVAIEHRDGSGLGSFVWTGVDSLLNSNESKLNERQRFQLRDAFKRGASESVVNLAKDETKSEAADNTNTQYDPLRDYSKVPYLPFEKVGLAPFMAKQGDKEMALRRAQLAMRAAEIKEALHVIRRINAGDSDWVASVHTRSLGSALCGAKRFRKARKHLDIAHCADFFAPWKGRIDVDFPTLAGHSFGGATLFEFLRTDQTDFQYGIILDPWMDPVRDPHQDPEVRGKLNKPVYVINSEGFTMWRDQYNKLMRVMVDATLANPDRRGWLMTLCGSNHGDFSDLPCLLPHIFGSPLPADHCMHSFTALTLEQVRLLRQQKHLFDIQRGEKPDNLGSIKEDIHMGGMHINSDPMSGRPSNKLLRAFQSKVLKMRTQQSNNKSLFWELKGWKKQAEQDPNTRAYRKHHRMITREIRREARMEHSRQKRRNSMAVSESSQADVQSLSEIQQEISGAQQEGADDEGEEEMKPSYVDPLSDRVGGIDQVWEGTVLDSDARKTYDVWEKEVAEQERVIKRPTSLLTFALWYLGIHEGLAPPGHLLVHTM